MCYVDNKSASLVLLCFNPLNINRFTSLLDKKIREVSRVFRGLMHWISRIG